MLGAGEPRYGQEQDGGLAVGFRTRGLLIAAEL